MENLKSKSVWSRIIVYSLFILINFMLVWFYGIPRIQAVDEISKVNEENLLRVEQLVKDKFEIKNNEEKIRELEALTADYEILVPQNLDTPQIVYDFYTYANLYGVTPVYLDFSLPASEGVAEGAETAVETPEENTGITALELGFSAKGTRANMIRFLENIGGITTQKLTVNSISLSSLEAGNMQVDISFMQYVQSSDVSGQPYSNYVFYLDTIGFDDIAALFGETPILPIPE